MAKASGKKSAGVALILSMFIPGVGQFYAGDIGMGIMFLILSFVAWSLIFTIIGAVIGLPMYTVIWIWAMVHAYKKAQEV